MVNKYTVRYLPLFYQDFVEILDYIKYSLKNPEAALKLISNVENAINERMQNPESFERFESIRERKYPYYRLYKCGENTRDFSHGMNRSSVFSLKS
ncbi:MAG: type II toxin-antitoxin system RelE/ParE family toxin [Acidaminobacter sp.]|uniref:type II toxin-antitoxin system RelE/ParE family toxin n=1 Tax=Acidaminobacter sp. TaxID=1872102 RepID=UPI0013802847|nr:type II toxin-antitoxin system RelE/ParE family toxin [Acidaminobacter sp.]MZQ97331.1 type II toxin-antitoxin system RelE/ParE family toxin [Acidaminobacter sp.]